jgi:hypothetical protein
MSLIHRAGTALLTTALAVTLVGGSATAQAASQKHSPAQQGADWLSGQLTHGLIHNGQFGFDDYGLTVDTAFALDAVGGHDAAVTRIRKALSKHAADYTAGTAATGDPGARYAGATAKLLVAAQDMGAKGRHFGGLNLVKRLTQRVSTSAPTKGRIEDKSGFGDFANTIGQIFAVRGLLKAHSPLAKPALNFLLLQQCPVFFRLDFNSDKTAADQGCTPKSTADSDVTALAVIELWPLRKRSGDLEKSLDVAVQWLNRHQADNGSFGGGGPTAAANTNSTGLAAWALGVAGRCGPAAQAATWVAQHQVTGDVSGTPLAGERGAIAYDHAAMKAARTDGITKATRDQWRRATTQAAPALTFQSAKACG